MDLLTVPAQHARQKVNKPSPPNARHPTSSPPNPPNTQFAILSSPTQLIMGLLKSVYQSFLENPNASALNNHASLNYITTLTTIKTAAAIVQHLAAHHRVLTKKEEKILSCIEGSDALCLDVETTLEFITGGGAYLPGLDDNFLADRVVTFPMVK